MIRQWIYDPSCQSMGHALEWFLIEFLWMVPDVNHGPPTRVLGHIIVHEWKLWFHLQLLEICIKFSFLIRDITLSLV